MANVVAVSVEGQENDPQRQPGSCRGKRSGYGFRMSEESAIKRQALACLSNHANSATGPLQLIKKPNDEVAGPFFDIPHSSAAAQAVQDTHRTTSPMLLSSPTLLTCTEMVTVNDESHIDTQGYSREIFAYLREAEVRFQPRAQYMLRQPDITASMRSVLVDWLVEVGDEFALQPSTLYLAVSIIDRFLSLMSVVRGKLQLVGTTAMYIAAKVEEIYPPELADFAYITDNTYTQKQIVQMEWLMLKTLDYHLLAPFSTSFLQHFLQAASPSPTPALEHLSQYLCEMSLVHSDPFLKYLPSEVASSSVCLARHTLNQLPVWPDSLERCTGYSVSDIGHCLQDMHRMFALASQQPQQAVRLKYCSDKFTKVALLPVPETLPV